MAYSGSVDLIAGIRPKNNGNFPLVNAADVYVEDGTPNGARLDAVLAGATGVSAYALSPACFPVQFTVGGDEFSIADNSGLQLSLTDEPTPRIALAPKTAPGGGAYSGGAVCWFNATTGVFVGLADGVTEPSFAGREPDVGSFPVVMSNVPSVRGVQVAAAADVAHKADFAGLTLSDIATQQETREMVQKILGILKGTVVSVLLAAAMPLFGIDDNTRWEQVPPTNTVKSVVEQFAPTPDMPQPSDSVPLIAGSAAAGTSNEYARADHTHPAETEVAAYALSDDCFPITYEDSEFPAGQQSCTIASNDGIRFELDSTHNIVVLHDVASEAAGGYEYGFSSFSGSTLKWSQKDAPIHDLKFNNTAPTNNTWPVLEKDVVFVREVRMAKSSDALPTTGGEMTGGLTVPNLTVGSRKGGSAIGANSVAEGGNATASGVCSHAEGNYATASEYYSHAEGFRSTASGTGAHAEGSGSTASGAYSHAEGSGSTASGAYSHAEGEGSRTQNYSEHAQGRYNASHKASDILGNAGNTLSSIGFGASDNGRKNAVETMQNGKTFIYGLGGYNGKNPTGTGVQDLATAINNKAPLDSPAFTGTPTAPDITAQSADGQIANKGYVDESVDYLYEPYTRHQWTLPQDESLAWNYAGNITSIKISDTSQLSGFPTNAKLYSFDVRSTTSNRAGDLPSGDVYAALYGDGPTTLAVSGPVQMTSFNTWYRFTFQEPVAVTTNTEYKIRFVTSTAASADKAVALSLKVDPNSKTTVYQSSTVHANWSTDMRFEFVNTDAPDSFTVGTRAPGYDFGSGSVVQGHGCAATGSGTHAEGYGTKALAECAHAEGYLATANGAVAHAEGYFTEANGTAAHTDGNQTYANGVGARAGGGFTTAAGSYSTALGYRAVTAEDGSRETATNSHEQAFVWQGAAAGQTPDYYHSHGYGTFNVNPVAGSGDDPASGFYIGEDSLKDRLDAVVQQLAPEFEVRDLDHAYMQGELVSKDGVVYQCDDASFAGPWSDSSWVAKKVSELFLPLTDGTVGDITVHTPRDYNTGSIVLYTDGVDGPYVALHDLNGNDCQFRGDGIYRKNRFLIQYPDAAGTLALLESPTFAGTPLAPDIGTNTASQVATKNYVDSALAHAAPTNVASRQQYRLPAAFLPVTCSGSGGAAVTITNGTDLVFEQSGEDMVSMGYVTDEEGMVPLGMFQPAPGSGRLVLVATLAADLAFAGEAPVAGSSPYLSQDAVSVLGVPVVNEGDLDAAVDLAVAPLPTKDYVRDEVSAAQIAMSDGFTTWDIRVLAPPVTGMPANAPLPEDLAVDRVSDVADGWSVFRASDTARTYATACGTVYTREDPVSLEWSEVNNTFGVVIQATRVRVPRMLDITGLSSTIRGNWTAVTNYIAWLENYATNNYAIAILANQRAKDIEFWQYTNSVTRADVENGATEWAVTPTWPVGRVVVRQITEGDEDEGKWSLFSPTTTVYSAETALVTPQAAPDNATHLVWDDVEWHYTTGGSPASAVIDIDARRTLVIGASSVPIIGCTAQSVGTGADNANGSTIMFRPRYFGMRAGDRLRGITFVTRSNWSTEVPEIHARLRDAEADGYPILGISLASSLPGTGGTAVTFAFPNSVALPDETHRYFFDFTEEGTTADADGKTDTGVTPLQLGLRTYSAVGANPDFFFQYNTLVPVFSVQYYTYAPEISTPKDVWSLSGRTFDFATMQGVLDAVRTCIELRGGSVTNMPSASVNANASAGN